MTHTDDKRREVAKRLRELAGGYVTIGDFQRAIGFPTSTEIDIDRDAKELRCLADLIDPTCEVESSHYEEYDYPVSWFEHELSCGHSVTWSWQTPPNYCPECGRRVDYDANHYI